MNTANLQLEGLYLLVASVCTSLVSKGLLSRDEMEIALRRAEESVKDDTRAQGSLSPANRDAMVFPIRLVRMALNGADETGLQPFSELAKMVGEQRDSPEQAEPDTAEGELFYASANGDRWMLLSDSGGRRFVQHIPNEPSGGAVQVFDLGSFRERESHSPQNRALEKVLGTDDLAVEESMGPGTTPVVRN